LEGVVVVLALYRLVWSGGWGLIRGLSVSVAWTRSSRGP
jgi:hypothetical protein